MWWVPVALCVCRQRFGAVIADKDGRCCVEQSQSPGCFVVNPT